MSGHTRDSAVSKLVHDLTSWAIDRHNFVASQSPTNLDAETVLPQLLELRHRVREILGQACKLGILNEVLSMSLSQLESRRNQLKVLTEEQTAAIDAETWTPDSGFLPEPFDLTLGQGQSKKRYVSLGGGKWASIPLDMSDEQIQQLRDKVREDYPENDGSMTSGVGQDEAYQHAQYRLLEAVHLHLSRFAMRMSDDEETSHWVLGNQPPLSPDGSPMTHELVGVVVAGNTEMAALCTSSFSEMVAKYAGADPRHTQVIGVTQLSRALLLLASPQALADLSTFFADRLAQGQDTVDRNDLRFQQLRDNLGLLAPEAFEDIEDVSLVVFSIVRRQSELQALWSQGGVDLSEEADDDDREAWVDMATKWMERHNMYTTYILPPAPMIEAICQLGASHLSALGQGIAAGVVALGLEHEVEANSLIDVVAFDNNEVSITRGKVPAWVFGLLEHGVSQQARKLFDLGVYTLSSDHNLDLDAIPSFHSSKEKSLVTVEPNAKRTLH